MKQYEKPLIEMIELRPEERLATCKMKLCGPFTFFGIPLFFLGCWYKFHNGCGWS